MPIKKLTLLFLLTFSYANMYGQFVKEFGKMTHIYKDWQNRGACDTLYYTDKISPALLTKAVDLISASKEFPLHVFYPGPETKPLTITSAEKSYLLSELKKLQEFKWPLSLFPNSKRISNTDFSKVFQVTEKFSEEKYHSCSLIYSFSKPIYLRNGTICLSLEEEIYDQSNSRMIIEFLTKIDGEWDHYAEVFTLLEEDGSPVKKSADTLISSIIRSQTMGTSNNAVTQPERLPDFGLRVFSAFQSPKNNSFPQLYPTLDQKIQIAKQMNLPVRKKSAAILESNHSLAILDFDYQCLNLLDTAKALNINWTKAMYSGITQYSILSPFTNQEGEKITFTGANIAFTESDRKFILRLERIYFLDGTWKTLGITGLTEIK